jgi:hypothetical protein
MFKRWASSEFSTDWGVRDLGDHEALYDPMSYHQGSVWPLFAGWASLAEYRTGHSLSGYAHLMQNVDLTWAQDLGAVTELLSGQYFEPLGRSTTHQLWSSAMVLSPALRGLFGVRYDAAVDTMTVQPQLPATWPGATLQHVPAGEGRRVTLVFARDGGVLTVREQAEAGALPRLVGMAGAQKVAAKDGVLRLPLAGAELQLPAQLPLPGAATAQLKVLQQTAGAHSATWLLAGKGGSIYDLPLRLNGVRHVTAEGASVHAGVATTAQTPLAGNALLLPSAAETPAAQRSTPKLESLQVQLPAGDDYVQQQVTVRW